MLCTSPAAKRPGIIEPCIPTLASKPPVGPHWIHEIKHDGYRLIARRRAGEVHLFTRRGYDWTERYPRIRKAVGAIPAVSAVIESEAVCCDEAGVAAFEKLHSRAHDAEVFLYAFDLLELDGEDWRPRRLEERKERLQALISGAPDGLQFSEHLEGDGVEIFAQACRLGCEGIVSKRRKAAKAGETRRAGPALTSCPRPNRAWAGSATGSIAGS
jgi:bifunctional non-homologous end joining protein LigD